MSSESVLDVGVHNYLQTALSHHLAGQTAAAEQEYRQILAQGIRHVGLLTNLATICLTSGRDEEGIGYLQTALECDPEAAATHANLGIALLGQGQIARGLNHLQRAVTLQPDHGDAHAYLGLALAQQGQYDAAVSAYRHAIALNPNHAEIHNNLGIALKELGHREAAKAAYEDALRVQPSYAQAYCNLGILLYEQGDIPAAIQTYQQALAVRPDFAEVYSNLGLAFHDQGDLAAAITAYHQAITLNPSYAQAYSNLGNAYKRQGQRQEAITAYQKALALNPRYAEAQSNLAIALYDDGLLDQAMALYHQACQNKPNYYQAYSNMGLVYYDQGKLDEAVATYQRALAINPAYHQARKNLAIAQLMQGNYAEGWRNYEYRLYPAPGSLEMPVNIPHGIEKWDGDFSYGGELLLITEQGFGDSFQFIRYVHVLVQQGLQVSIQSTPHVQSLFSRLPGIHAFYTHGTPHEGDYRWFPLISLPHLLQTTLDTIPIPGPYLSAAPDRVATWQAYLGAQPTWKIGIAWQGNPTTERNNLKGRSFPLSHFSLLTALPGIEWISLQKGYGAEQLLDCPFRDRFVSCQPLISAATDWEDTAAIMMHCDLIITSDTSIAHLAGALGRPTWVALGAVPDWRWLMHREDSPWYPTLRLFRQSQPGQWDPVFAAMKAGIAILFGGSPTALLDPAAWQRAVQKQQAGHYAAAEQDYQRFMAEGCRDHHLWGNVAALCLLSQRYGEASALLTAALTLQPHYPEGHFFLGLLNYEQSNWIAAEAAYQRAVMLNPGFVEAYANLGNTLKAQGDLEAAITWYEKALALNPQLAVVHSNLGVALKDRGQLDEAVSAFQRALQLNPRSDQALSNLSFTYLLQGNFILGWPAYESRLTLHQGRELLEIPTGMAQWNEDFDYAGELILVTEQGLGDAIQFLRFALVLRQRGMQVSVQCPASLVSLFSRVAGLRQVYLHQHRYPAGNYRWYPLMSLPKVLSTDVATIPHDVPYLQARPEKIAYWHAKVMQHSTLKIGLAWQGNPQAERQNLHGRSFRLAEYQVLTAIAGIEFIALQKGYGSEQWADCPFQSHFVACQSEILAANDWEDTAALMMLCDLVITSDTSIAHLAGALGRPTWVALSFVPDWRWLMQRADSPWYPTLRLFRQTQPGQWSTVFEHIQVACQDWVQKNQPKPLPVIAQGSLASTELALDSNAARVEAALSSGQELKAQGQWVAARIAYEQALSLNAQEVRAWIGLGKVWQAQGNDDQALFCFQQVLQIEPVSATGHFLIGNTFYRQGRLTEAIQAYQEALHRDPALYLARLNLGNAYKETQQWEAAITTLQQVIEFKPDLIEAYLALGMTFQAQGSLAAAVTLYRTALDRYPVVAEFSAQLGVVLAAQQNWEAAKAAYQHALRLKPLLPDLYSCLGLVFYQQGDLEQAMTFYQQELVHHPAAAHVHSNLGMVYYDLGQLEAAVAAFEQAITLQPTYAEAYGNLGMTLYQQGQLEAAIAAYQEALRLKPAMVDTHVNLAYAYLLHGDWPRGWVAHEARLQSERGRAALMPPPGIECWDGDFGYGGELLLVTEQGYGDGLQFIRYALLLHARGLRVSVQCHPALIPLFARMPSLYRVYPIKHRYAAGDYRWFPLMSVPLLFETTVDTVPCPIPYLSVAPEKMTLWEAKIGQRRTFKIGMAWQGNPAAEINNLKGRSFPLAHYQTLATLDGVEFLALQKGFGVEQLSDCPFLERFIPCQADISASTGWDDTAAIIMHCDLIITSDSAIAHLAGALGKPTWVALAVSPDWRWLLQRTDSPWYPTMRLFRQTVAGNWGEVFTAIREAVVALLSQGSLAPEAEFQRLVTLHRAGQVTVAEAGYRQLWAQGIRYPHLLGNLATICLQSGRFTDAIALLTDAITRYPTFAEAYSSLGIAYYELNQLPKAIQAYEQAIALKPDYAEAFSNLGNALKSAGKLNQALVAYERAIRQKPDFPGAHANFAYSLLLTGNLERGWQEYEYRLQVDRDPPSIAIPVDLEQWDQDYGYSGELILVAEQGLGDAIQFVRYAVLLSQVGMKVSVQCHASLLPLFARVSGLHRVYPHQYSYPLGDYRWFPLMSVPKVVRTRMETIPSAPAYLRALPEKIGEWQHRIGQQPTLKIGIAWQGNPDTERNNLKGRSFSLSVFEEIASLPGIELIALQKGFGKEQLADCAFLDRFVACQPLITASSSWEDTCALIMLCDLIITTDTSVAHLAGALGKLTWIALSAVPDWRWFLNRDNSPWYPTVRLFRQTEPGQWAPVFAAMAQEVQRLIASPLPASPPQECSTRSNSGVTMAFQVISLERCPEKLQRFYANNSHLPFRVDPFRAIDGTRLDRGTVVQDLFGDQSHQYYNEGSLGCLLSHRALWLESITRDQPYVIFEDDAVIAPNTKEYLEHFNQQHPEWDIILLGYNTDSILSYQVAESLVFHTIFSVRYPSLSQINAIISPPQQRYLARLIHAFGLCGYAVSPVGAQKLIAALFPIKGAMINLPVIQKSFPAHSLDCLTNTLYKDLNAFTIIPPLVLSPNSQYDSTTR